MGPVGSHVGTEIEKIDHCIRLRVSRMVCSSLDLCTSRLSEHKIQMLKFPEKIYMEKNIYHVTPHVVPHVGNENRKIDFPYMGLKMIGMI